MLQFLIALFTRFSFAQIAVAFATVSVATVAVAGSAQVMAPAGTDASESGRGGTSPLAVLASPLEIDPSWTVNKIRYQLSDVPTSIATISFLVVAPETKPAEVVVQASHPVGARYRCSMVAAGADVVVTCPTDKPALPVAEANRPHIEVRS